jgi:hypothetical protein
MSQQPGDEGEVQGTSSRRSQHSCESAAATRAAIVSAAVLSSPGSLWLEAAAEVDDAGIEGQPKPMICRGGTEQAYSIVK